VSKNGSFYFNKKGKIGKISTAIKMIYNKVKKEMNFVEKATLRSKRISRVFSLMVIVLAATLGTVFAFVPTMKRDAIATTPSTDQTTGTFLAQMVRMNTETTGANTNLARFGMKQYYDPTDGTPMGLPQPHYLNWFRISSGGDNPIIRVPGGPVVPNTQYRNLERDAYREQYEIIRVSYEIPSATPGGAPTFGSRPAQFETGADNFFMISNLDRDANRNLLPNPRAPRVLGHEVKDAVYISFGEFGQRLVGFSDEEGTTPIAVSVVSPSIQTGRYDFPLISPLLHYSYAQDDTEAEGFMISLMLPYAIPATNPQGLAMANPFSGAERRTVLMPDQLHLANTVHSVGEGSFATGGVQDRFAINNQGELVFWNSDIAGGAWDAVIVFNPAERPTQVSSFSLANNAIAVTSLLFGNPLDDDIVLTDIATGPCSDSTWILNDNRIMLNDNIVYNGDGTIQQLGIRRETLAHTTLPEGAYTIAIGAHIMADHDGNNFDNDGFQIHFNLVLESSFFGDGKAPTINGASLARDISGDKIGVMDIPGVEANDPPMLALSAYQFYGQTLEKPTISFDPNRFWVTIDTSHIDLRGFEQIFRWEIKLISPAPFANNLLVTRERRDSFGNLTGQRVETRTTYTGERLEICLENVGTYLIEYQTVIIDQSTGSMEYRPQVIAGADMRFLHLSSFGFEMMYTDRTTARDLPLYHVNGQFTLTNLLNSPSSGLHAGTQQQTQGANITEYMPNPNNNGTSFPNTWGNQANEWGFPSIPDPRNITPATFNAIMSRLTTGNTPGATGGEIPGGLVSTNQPPVDFNFVGSLANAGTITRNSQIYFMPFGRTEVLTSSFTRDRLFEQTGRYLVRIEFSHIYNLTLNNFRVEMGRKASTQWFAFEINTTNPTVSVRHAAETDPSEGTATWRPITSGTHTNKTVRIDIMEHSVFDIPPNFTFQQIALGSNNTNVPTHNMFQNVEGTQAWYQSTFGNSLGLAMFEKYGWFDGRFTRMFFAPDAALMGRTWLTDQEALGQARENFPQNGQFTQHNGHYVLTARFGTQGSTVPFDFYIDTQPIIIAPKQNTRGDTVPTPPVRESFASDAEFETALNRWREQSWTEFLRRFSAIDDKTFVTNNMVWFDFEDVKASGATVGVEFAFTPINQDLSIVSGDHEDALNAVVFGRQGLETNNSLRYGHWAREANQEIWVQARFMLENRQLSQNFIPYTTQSILATSGIYVFRITDTAGNVTYYYIILDRDIRPNTIILEDILDEHDADNPSNPLSVNLRGGDAPATHNVIWGTHKALELGDDDFITTNIGVKPVGYQDPAVNNPLLKRNALGSFMPVEETQGVRYFEAFIDISDETDMTYLLTKNIGVGFDDDAEEYRIMHSPNQFNSLDLPTRLAYGFGIGGATGTARTVPSTRDNLLAENLNPEKDCTVNCIGSVCAPECETVWAIVYRQGFTHRRSVSDAGFWLVEVKQNEGTFLFGARDVFGHNGTAGQINVNFDLAGVRIESQMETDNAAWYQGGRFPDLAGPTVTTSRDRAHVGVRDFGGGIVNDVPQPFEVETVTYTFNQIFAELGEPAALYSIGTPEFGVSNTLHINYLGAGRWTTPDTMLNPGSDEKTLEGRYTVSRRYTPEFESPIDIDGFETDEIERIWIFGIDRGRIIDVSQSIGQDNVLILQDAVVYSHLDMWEAANIELNTNFVPVAMQVLANKYGVVTASYFASVFHIIEEDTDYVLPPNYLNNPMRAIADFIEVLKLDIEGATRTSNQVELERLTSIDRRIKQLLSLIVIGGELDLNIQLSSGITSFNTYNMHPREREALIHSSSAPLSSNNQVVDIFSIIGEEDGSYRESTSTTNGGLFIAAEYAVLLRDRVDVNFVTFHDDHAIAREPFLSNRMRYAFEIDPVGPQARYFEGSEYGTPTTEAPRLNDQGPILYQVLNNQLIPTGQVEDGVVAIRPTPNTPEERYVSFAFDDPADRYSAQIDWNNVTVLHNGVSVTPLVEFRKIENSEGLGTHGGDNHRRRYFIKLDASREGDVFAITVRFTGDLDNYVRSTGEGFGEERYVLIIDNLRPEGNLTKLLQTDRFLFEFLNRADATHHLVVREDEQHFARDVIGVLNSETDDAVMLRSYSFVANRSHFFEHTRTNNVILNNSPLERLEERYSPRLDSYQIWIREVRESNAGNRDLSLFSILPDDDLEALAAVDGINLDRHPIFDPNNLDYKLIQYGPQHTLQSILTFYNWTDETNFEIIERDMAGNFRGFFIYVPNPEEATIGPSMSVSFYNEIPTSAAARQQTLNLTHSPAPRVVNAIYRPGDATRNFVVNNVSSPDKWFMVTVMDRTDPFYPTPTATNSRTFFSHGYLNKNDVMKHAEEYIQEQLTGTGRVDTIAGSSYSLTIHNRNNPEQNLRVIFHFAGAFVDIDNVNPEGQPIVIGILGSAFNASTTITHTLHRYVNNVRQPNPILTDNSTPAQTIAFEQGQVARFTLTAGVYRLWYVDNFGRTDTKAITNLTASRQHFDGAINVPHPTGPLYATQNLRYRYNPQLHTVTIQERNLITGGSWVTMNPANFTTSVDPAGTGLRVISFNERVNVRIEIRILLNSTILENSTTIGPVIYDSTFPELEAWTAGGENTTVAKQSFTADGELITHFARLTYETAPGNPFGFILTAVEEQVNPITGLSVHQNMGQISSGTPFERLHSIYHLTFTSNLGFTRNYTIIIEEQDARLFWAIDSRGNRIETSPIFGDEVVIMNENPRIITRFFTIDTNPTIQINPIHQNNVTFSLFHTLTSGQGLPTDALRRLRFEITATGDSTVRQFADIYVIRPTTTLSGLNRENPNEFHFGVGRTIQATNDITNTDPAQAHSLITFTSRSTDASTSSFYGNLNFDDIYYEGRLVQTVGRSDVSQLNSAGSARVRLSEPGRYTLVFRDLAGNTHRIASGGVTTTQIAFYVLTEAMLSAESTNFNSANAEHGAALRNMVYENSVRLTATHAHRFSAISMKAMLNGEEAFESSELQPHILNLTRPGFYELTVTYSVPNASPPVQNRETRYTFFIIDPSIARLGIDYAFMQSRANVEIVSGLRFATLNPNEIGRPILDELFAVTHNRNQIQLSSFDRTPDRNGMLSDGRYSFTVRASFGTASEPSLRTNTEYTFRVFISNENPLIQTSQPWATKTNDPFTISFNPSFIYHRNGTVFIEVFRQPDQGGERVLIERVEVNSESPDRTEHIENLGAFNSIYIVQVVTPEGFILMRNMVFIGEPLNTVAVVLIVVASILLVAGIFFFVRLRYKMKVR